MEKVSPFNPQSSELNTIHRISILYCEQDGSLCLACLTLYFIDEFKLTPVIYLYKYLIKSIKYKLSQYILNRSVYLMHIAHYIQLLFNMKQLPTRLYFSVNMILEPCKNVSVKCKLHMYYMYIRKLIRLLLVSQERKCLIRKFKPAQIQR